MKCIRCSRPLLRASVSVHKGSTVFAYGPKCAKDAGLIDAKGRYKVVRAKVSGTSWIDPQQLALELVATDYLVAT